MSKFSNTFYGQTKGWKWLRVTLFLLFAICVLGVSLNFFVLSMVKPYMGMKLSMNNRGWEIESIDVNGVAYQAGIKKGDILVEINSQPAETFLERYRDAGVVLGMLIKELTVIDESGQVKSVSLKDSSPSTQSVIVVIAWFFISSVFWIIGFYVLLKRPRNVSALLLCLCGMVFGLALSATIAGDRTIPAAVHLAVITMVFGPWVLLHFFLVLPEERTRLRDNPLFESNHKPQATLPYVC